MKVDASFVRSAAGERDFPPGDLPEIALVGRSNVGKSSLINALVRSRIARTSSAPGKTRLANIYRVARGGAPLYLVDLPGFGYARALRQVQGGPRIGRESAAEEFEALTAAYFGRAGQADIEPASRTRPAVAALLLVDSRHPGLERDLEAWAWLKTAAPRHAVVATKIDKLARGERIRAMRELESVLEHSVLPVSAVTGEGLDELWILIDRLAGSSNSSSRDPRPPRPTAPTKATTGHPNEDPRRAPRKARRTPRKR